MSQISIIGDEGKPVLYASLTLDGKLFFEFELYGSSNNRLRQFKQRNSHTFHDWIPLLVI